MTTTGGLNLTNVVLTSIATVTFDSASATGQTLTLTGATLNGADITSTGSGGLVTTTGGLDASNVVFTSIATVTFDSGSATGQALTLTGATLNGADITSTGTGGLVTTTCIS